MKNTILGALMCFLVTCFALPAIAAPIESPPRAQPAQENLSALSAVPTAHEFSGDIYAPRSCAIQNIGYALLSNYKIVDTPTLFYVRCSENPVISFRFAVGLRQMTTAPPVV